jgi:hypothetical protein
MDKRLTASGCRSRWKAFILLPVALLLVISVSGCTGISSIDSLFGGFCIPGIGTCGQTTEYANDVLIIKTLDAVPQTISTGQQLRLSAWIENNGGETVPQKTFTSGSESGLVRVQLFDTCEGLFDNIEATCPPDSTQTDDKRGCWIKSILPKQTIPISWSLRAKDKTAIPLETSCNLKVYVRYPYETKSITSVTFVDYTEYQRMINENKYSPITSYITEGYGPIKPYLTVETTQPIPVENGKQSDFQMAFQVKNKGSGFITNLYEKVDDKTFVGITNDDIKITSNTNPGSSPSNTYDLSSRVTPEIEKLGNIVLIGADSPKQSFSIKAPYDNKIEKIASYYVSTSVDYMYEFRKEIKVTIKPPAITG